MSANGLAESTHSQRCLWALSYVPAVAFPLLKLKVWTASCTLSKNICLKAVFGSLVATLIDEITARKALNASIIYESIINSTFLNGSKDAAPSLITKHEARLTLWADTFIATIGFAVEAVLSWCKVNQEDD